MNKSAPDATPQVLESAFKDGLVEQTEGNTIKLILGTDYVLSTSPDGVNFTPLLDNIIGKSAANLYYSKTQLDRVKEDCEGFLRKYNFMNGN